MGFEPTITEGRGFKSHLGLGFFRDTNIGNEKDTFKSAYFQCLLYLPCVSLKAAFCLKDLQGEYLLTHFYHKVNLMT